MATKIANLEALLYVAGDEGLDKSALCGLLELNETELEALFMNLKDKLEKDPDNGLQAIHVNQTYKLTTRPETSKIIEKYFQKDLSKGISQSALEILAIVAYKQPITRVEIDDIRGVNSSGAIQTLVWRGLIKASGKKNAPGNPNLYITTDYFLQYFGYESLADLPLIENFEDEVSSESEVDLFKLKDKENESEES